MSPLSIDYLKPNFILFIKLAWMSCTFLNSNRNGYYIGFCLFGSGFVEKKKKKETERNYKNTQKTINKMAINTYLSIITLIVNVNLPIKTYRVAEWIKKQNSGLPWWHSG